MLISRIALSPIVPITVLTSRIISPLSHTVTAPAPLRVVNRLRAGQNTAPSAIQRRFWPRGQAANANHPTPSPAVDAGKPDISTMSSFDSDDMTDSLLIEALASHDTDVEELLDGSSDPSRVRGGATRTGPPPPPPRSFFPPPADTPDGMQGWIKTGTSAYREHGTETPEDTLPRKGGEALYGFGGNAGAPHHAVGGLPHGLVGRLGPKDQEEDKSVIMDHVQRAAMSDSFGVVRQDLRGGDDVSAHHEAGEKDKDTVPRGAVYERLKTQDEIVMDVVRRIRVSGVVSGGKE
ncbi:hypothetical protein M427DRAFT_57090 [Gonapodya prolifera JEL478]|uniref:Uncharacterized protein n=1 Tax=Gonapodya prolifera (strain JEL478) TaxID=1344416 RepID=A0A139ADV4_GONPJ|nr:hypothetical protein M427DRAFT_57090 [Gonapodya prolifera JEL478]|eukprot:KXS14940.1 hypothetical protein M427DRAFT_57090 [Gonapodya prolifera JEL478]